MKRDLSNDLQVRRAIDPASTTDNTAIVSQKIDMAGFFGLVFAIACGSLADADATFVVLVEDSPDNSTFTAVDDAYLIGTELLAAFVFSDDNTVHKIGYIGPQQYVRLTITPANNTGAALVSAVAILGHARHLPRSAQN